MKKIDLGQTITILANIGVIAGIVFLAVELRQNNELIAAESRATRVVLNADIWSSVAEQSDLAPILIKDRRGENLSDVEELRMNGLWVRSLYNAEYQYNEAPEAFEIVEGWRRAFASYGSLRRTWAGNSAGSAVAGKHLYGASFVEFMDNNVVNWSAE